MSITDSNHSREMPQIQLDDPMPPEIIENIDMKSLNFNDLSEIAEEESYEGSQNDWWQAKE